MKRLMWAGLLLVLATAFANAQDWPQILGPTRNGIYSGAPIVLSFPRTGPPLLWKRNVGAG